MSGAVRAHHRATRTVAIALAAGLFGTGLASNTAASTPSAKTVTITASGPRSPFRPIAAATIITTCVLQINYPYVSTHVPENVNAVGTATCDFPVGNIWLVVNLYYNGYDYAYGYSYTNYGKSSAQANATTGCLSGSYYASMDYFVSWLPGSTPATSSGTVVTPPVSVKC